MTSYEKHLQQRGLTEYSLDGAIDPTKWAESNVRILFLLKETYGYQRCGVNRVTDCVHGWLDANIPTYVKATALAAALQIGCERGYSLTAEEVIVLSTDQPRFHRVLDTIAMVNIKKHSGHARSNDAEIRRESRLNAPILNTQIEALSPTVVIAGGTVCWHSLVYDLSLFSSAPNCPKNQSVVCNNKVLCHSNHPSAWSGGGFNIHALHCSILSALHETQPSS